MFQTVDERAPTKSVSSNSVLPWCFKQQMNMWFYCQELQNMCMSNWCYICYRGAKQWLNEVWSDFEGWHRCVWFLMAFLLLFWYSSILLNRVFLLVLFFTAFCSHNPFFCSLCIFWRAHWVRGFITSCYHISHRQPTVTWCFLLLVADFRPFQCAFYHHELDQRQVSNSL